MPSLRNPMLKLARARKHLTDLKAVTNDFLKGEAYRVWSEFNTETSGEVQMILFAQQVGELPQDEWAGIIGDFAHDARSSLSYLVYQLSLLRDAKPKGTDFPIWLKRPEPGKETRAYARKVHYLTDTQRAVIEGMQPYNRGDIETARRDPLGVLAELNDPDKHEDFNIILGRGFLWGIKYDNLINCRLVGCTLTGASVGKTQTHIATLVLAVHSDGFSVDVDATPICEVRISQGDSGETQLLIPQLQTILDHIERIFSRFKADLPAEK